MANGHGLSIGNTDHYAYTIPFGNADHNQIKSTLYHKNNGSHTNTLINANTFIAFYRHCSISVKQVVASPTIPMCKYLRFDLVLCFCIHVVYSLVFGRNIAFMLIAMNQCLCVCAVLRERFDGIPGQSRVMQRLLNVRCCLLLRHFDIPNVIICVFLLLDKSVDGVA